MCHYTHFTTEEREKSRVLKAQGLSIREIARTLNRPPSTISREFRRNCYVNGDYAAHHADKLYQKRRKKRRKNCRRKPILQNGTTRDYVLEKMSLWWSPEQIAGRSKLDNEPFVISFPTIYRAIDSGVLPPQLKKLCVLNGSIRSAKERANEEKSPIPYQSASALSALKTVPVSIIGKVIRYLECAKQAASALMLSVNQDFLLLLE